MVIDTPAFDEASDALATAAEADSVVIVVRLGRTTAASLAHLAESLDAAGIQPTGYAVIGAAPSASAASRALLGGDRAARRPDAPEGRCVGKPHPGRGTDRPTVLIPLRVAARRAQQGEAGRPDAAVTEQVAELLEPVEIGLAEARDEHDHVGVLRQRAARRSPR